MKNSFSSFFKLVWFEFLKVLRNPVVLLFLLIGPLVMEITMGLIMNSTMGISKPTKEDAGISQSTINQNIVFTKNGALDDDVNETITSFFSGAEITWSEDTQNAINKLHLQQCLAVFYVDTEKEPQEITIYYDGASTLSQSLANQVRLIQLQYVSVAVLEYLDSEWGITIQDEYFNVANFTNTAKDSNFFSRYFSLLYAVFLAFVLAIGLSFSIARDNETNVFKQLCYTPISTNRYLLIKGFLFVLFAMLNACLMLLGGLIFGLTVTGSVIILLLITLLFVMSFGALNMLLSTAKSQIGAVCLALLFILVPALVESMLTLNIMSPIFQILTLISPLMPFLELCQSYVLYGVLNWVYLVIMAVEMVAYYILAVCIIKHKTGTNKIKVKKQNKNEC